MFFSYCDKLRQKGAFSLIEVMMTLLILSLAVVLMAPVITKRHTALGKRDGVVFTYDPGNNVTDATKLQYCLRSVAGSSAAHMTGRCSKYTFTVPDGVTKVNITMVGGGGGGGGAAGGKVISHNIHSQSDNSKWANYNLEKIKKFVVNYITEIGEKNAYECLPGSGSSYLCGKKGGDSSPAIIDYEIPVESIRENNPDYSEAPLLANTSDYPKLFLETLFGSGAVFRWYIEWKGSNSINRSTLKEHTYSVVYLEKRNSKAEVELNSKLKFALPTINYLPPAKGDYGSFLLAGGTVGEILEGGKGGRQNNRFSDYGYGQVGDDCSIISNGSHATNTCSHVKRGEVGPQYIEATIETEEPGGAGSGGVGGTAIKILNVDVNPGARYTIYVGAGGAGGSAGTTGSTATAGSPGQGGSSTAILNENENNVLYIVSGGNNGFGGSVWNSSSGYAGSVPNISAISNANPHYLFAGSQSSSVKVDPEFFLSSASVSPNGWFIGQTNVRHVLSRIFEDISTPYYSFVRNQTSFDTLPNAGSTAAYDRDKSTWSTRYSDVNIQPQYTPFNAFNNALTYMGGMYYVTNTDTISYPYTGFYYRALVNKTGAYVGGLGGFNSFGGKAGCGAFFKGNFNASTLDNMYLSDMKKAAIQDSFAWGNRFYKVSDFYDNCNLNSPDGQSANFVMPDPVKQTVGQAGAGGGGGGYNIVLGSGKGGDGQDGYVMIDWVK